MMSKIKVTKAVTIRANDEGTATVHYDEGFEGTIPNDHIERIVAAGAGERVQADGSKAPEKADAKK